MDLIQELLLQLLTDAEPRSLLCVAPATPPAVSAWLAGSDGRRLTELDPADAGGGLAELGRYDFALVTEALEGLSAEAGTTLLSRLRDVHCHRFAVTYRRPRAASAAADSYWTDGRFLGLTLALHRRVSDVNGAETAIYTYDIDSYNRQRDWNTPEDWAHPGNFNRWRW